MALEGDQVGLERLYFDTSDTTVTFPNCPDASEFFKPQRTSTRKSPDKVISEKIQYQIVMRSIYAIWSRE